MQNGQILHLYEKLSFGSGRYLTEAPEWRDRTLFLRLTIIFLLAKIWKKRWTG